MNETRKTAAQRSKPVDGRAIISLILALASLALISLPIAATLLAATSIIAAVSSRTRLRANSQLRGARLGVAAAILSIFTLCLTVIPALFGVMIFASNVRF